MLKKMMFALTVAALSLSVAHAETKLAEGEVTKIDTKQGKITVRHGPIPSLGMTEGMTMVFRVKDKAMLETAKPGDKIEFDVERLNGALTITVLEKRS
jgi:Cu/Ag efflux protein CusF